MWLFWPPLLQQLRTGFPRHRDQLRVFLPSQRSHRNTELTVSSCHFVPPVTWPPRWPVPGDLSNCIFNFLGFIHFSTARLASPCGADTPCSSSWEGLPITCFSWQLMTESLTVFRCLLLFHLLHDDYSAHVLKTVACISTHTPGIPTALSFLLFLLSNCINSI